MKVRWSARARRDLVEIGRYIARDKPGAARRWIERLSQTARRAARFPMAGRVVPEAGRPEVREVIVGTYRIVYLVSSNEVWVLMIFEGHRSWPGIPPLEEEDEP